MKLIIAVIRPEALEPLKEALLKEDVAKMTVSQVRGCGQQMGYTETYRGNIVNVNLLSKIRVEIAVNDDFEQRTVDAIMRAARTGKIGDGKIFVLPIEKCYRIRTGEEGPLAIG